MTSSTTQGEPDAGKLACPVRREACRNLLPRGSKALHAYSTRTLVARKYDGSDRRGKRGPKPTKANMIRKLVIQMAQENGGWGYGRIYGELKKLGYDVHWQSPKLKAHERGQMERVFRLDVLPDQRPDGDCLGGVEVRLGDFLHPCLRRVGDRVGRDRH